MAEGMCGLEAIGNVYVPANTISVLNGNKVMMAGVWIAVDGSAVNVTTTVTSINT
jgi:hypothetical protein